jgi:protein-L-isoaspartate(D-aspartate) O-methyltransferase
MIPGLTHRMAFAAFLTVVTWAGAAQNNPDVTFAEQRQQMVDRQIRQRGITDRRVLDAMLRVERHLFVPPSAIPEAYEDYPLSIGEGQTISQPYIVAFMTQALRLQSTDKVLEIGTGSGYQAAVLAEICDSVFTIEIFPSLAERAALLLQELGYANIFVKSGDGYQGWPEYAPFQAIIVTCSPTHIPPDLAIQLAEGGRMIIPVGETNAQSLVIVKKEKGKLVQHEVLPVRFVPMIDEKGKTY